MTYIPYVPHVMLLRDTWPYSIVPVKRPEGTIHALLTLLPELETCPKRTHALPIAL